MIRTFEIQTSWAKCQGAITSQVALLLADLCPRYSKLATVKATKAIQAEAIWLEYILTEQDRMGNPLHFPSGWFF